jgi:NAD(P)H-dependent FMN reductase
VLKELFRANHGLLISSPEYNSSLSAALKNAIDWVSRPEPGQPPLSCFLDKVAGLMATSTGALGGLRGLVHLRAILQNIRVTVVPHQMAIPNAAKAFAEDGSLPDQGQREAVERIGGDVARMLAKLLA